MKEVHNKKKISDIVDVNRPFLGLRSYEEKNKSQFGGRDAEIQELFNLVQNNRLTTIFGKSGIGKTSLINAGLIPELQKNYFFPVYMRIDYSANKPPLGQLRELIYEKLKMSDKNIPEIGERTLWEYFHDVRFLDGLITPILILDQFEEAFTIGIEKSHEVHELIIELSDLAENRVPLVVEENQNKIPLVEEEEHQNKSEMISSGYDEQNYHVIISLREDYLAQLESLKGYLPSIKNSRFRVVQMTVYQAMYAVMKPAKSLIEQDVAVAIIKKLPGISDIDFDIGNQESVRKLSVEPFLLSLICYEINEMRIEKGLDKIYLELVSRFDISNVIQSYYNKTMQGFDENFQEGIENSLLTERGYRKLQDLEELKVKYNISNNNIQQLIDKRIIRKEFREGVEYVELIHDILTPVIKEKRDKRLTELREKEKTEAIRRAIELEKVKRKKIALWMIILSFSTVLVAYIALNEYLQNAESVKRFENQALAQKLLIIAERVSGTPDSTDINGVAYASNTLISTAALISRAGFIINKKYSGKYDVNFYKSMYERLLDLGVNFEFLNTDTLQMQITAITTPGDDIFYFGYENGKVFKKDGTADEQLFCDLKEKVTSLAISVDKRYLAVAGISPIVRVFGLSKTSRDSTELHTGDINGKSVCFTEDGKLILLLDSTIIGWEIDSLKPILWKKRIQVEVENETKVIVHDRVVWNKDSFRYAGVNTFNCMAVFKDRIAVGIDSGVLFINKDSIIKINTPDLGNPTAIAFSPSGEYLFIGNVEGTLCRMSLTEFRTEFDRYQTGRIINIACSSDGNYMASVSWDGTIGICDTKTNWNAPKPLLLSWYRESIPFCIAFSQNNENILAGYINGYILKWPVNMEILADLICKKVNTSLDTTLWKKYIKQDVTIKEIEDYTCNNNRKN